MTWAVLDHTSHTPSAVCLRNALLRGLLLICRPQKDGRLSWPRWLTYGGQFCQAIGYIILDDFI